MARRSRRPTFTLVAALVIGGLGWLTGYVVTASYLVIPIAERQSSPVILGATLVFIAGTSTALAIAAAELLWLAADFTGTVLIRWRCFAALWYLAAVAASAALVLYPHWQPLAQPGG